jgi:alanine racemase
MKYIRLHEALPILPDELPGSRAGLRGLAVIDTAALARNYRALLAPVRAVSPHTYPIAVVKADAYGHGIRPVVSTLLGEGCRSFAVACPAEAVALRRLLRELLPNEGDAPHILVLGYSAPESAAVLAEYNITTTLLSEEYTLRLLDCARRAGVSVQVHAALDTGMNRIGYPAHTDEEIAGTVEALTRLFGGGAGDREADREAGGLILDGLFTHFARADEDYDDEMCREDSLTLTQYARYRRVLEALAERGIRPRVCHVCNSAAAIRFPHALPEGCMDAVRLGISLYGYGVDFPQDTGTTCSLSVLPVMRLKTLVTHVHILHPGETVGYGGTFTADTVRTLATLPIGYADGWIRDLSGATVTFHTDGGDVTAPIVGRICMDQCMADVTGLPVTVGTPVTLFGQTAGELEALAKRANTITYELLCLITARIPRVYE